MEYKNYGLVEVKKGRYSNGNLALVLIKANLASPVTVITVNTNEILGEGLAYVKDYSENLGMLKAIQEAGLVKELLSKKQLKYNEVTLVRFNMEGIEEM